ncbi:MAG: hypothetical protein FWE05_13085 [Defluviitaleaceae bacterium]|nr:hypothetical protein [Defluviitaleaceae bacterium]
MTTVKELENQLKVSKVSIYLMLKKDEIKGHVFKGENNLTLIDDIGVELLKAHYLRERGETLKDIADEEINHSKAESKVGSKDDEEIKNPEIIEFLQRQLEVKDEQINNLLSIVLNQQKLQATQLLTDSQQNAVNSIQPEEPQQKGFFKRIFGKK